MPKGIRNMDRGTHETQRGRETYTPPSLLDMPEMPDTDMYVYRWIRVELGGEVDTKNITMRLREGWTFVKLDELPDKAAFAVVDAQKGSSLLENLVKVGDVALAKLPRAKSEAYKRYVEGMAQAQADAVTRKNVKASADGREVYLDNESSQRVTRGQVDLRD